jgi:hypothetical protein
MSSDQLFVDPPLETTPFRPLDADELLSVLNASPQRPQWCADWDEQE